MRSQLEAANVALTEAAGALCVAAALAPSADAVRTLHALAADMQIAGRKVLGLLAEAITESAERSGNLIAMPSASERIASD